ncbi:MAG: winged helix-turn-helix transcriptional regulator [Bacteroides sp.]|nr:winged helix-turn-helix transcriptional regulator [Bacteroides sp.]
MRNPPDVLPRVEYSVPKFGKTLFPHVEALMKWGQENFEQIMHNRHKNI